MTTELKLISQLEKCPLVKMVTLLESIKVDDLLHIKQILDQNYYNSIETPDGVSECYADDRRELLSDSRYDILFNYLEKVTHSKQVTLTSVKEDSKKIKLPYWMGSMDKRKTKEEISKWLSSYKGHYVVTPKLDGVSCLVEIKKDGKVQMYTRGDGKIGTDISHLANFVKGIPTKIPNMFYRGELIISNTNFETFKADFKNARQLVSGTVNSKTVREDVAKCIRFISYEVINNDKQQPIFSTQLEMIEAAKGLVIPRKIIQEVTIDSLTEILVNWRETFDYYIDGIVVYSNQPYIRNTSANPDYAFAYKINLEENTINTEVIDVVWNVSKRGLIKPTVKLQPVELSGVTIQNATGFNAKFIVDHSIGKGAIVKIVRSGDVIPHILEVIKKGKVNLPTDEYEWNDTKVDFIVKDQENEEMVLATLTYFFKKIGVKSVSTQTIAHFYEEGLTTIQLILAASPEDYNMGDVISTKIHENIKEAMKNVSIPCLAAASGLLGSGMGEKKIETLLESIPNLFQEQSHVTLKQIIDVKGFSDKTATLVMENLDKVKAFLKNMKVFQSHPPPFEVKKDVDVVMNDVVMNDVVVKKIGRILFTGFRNKDLEQKAKAKGYEIMSSISKNTTLLIVKKKADGSIENSSKVEKARELGVKIMDVSDFERLL